MTVKKINEPIQVLVKFTENKVEPIFFKWQNTTYKIEKINLIHKSQIGRNKIYFFSVSNHFNYFQLAFHTKNLSWKLQEISYEY